MKALVGAFNQEKALVGAFSVIVLIVQPVVEPMDRFAALFLLLAGHAEHKFSCVVQGQEHLHVSGEQPGDSADGVSARLPQREDPARHAQVSCDWWRAGHVTPVLISDWSSPAASTTPSAATAASSSSSTG